MDISAVSVSKAVPPTFCSSFSDQSHLQFYGRGRSGFLTPCKLRFGTRSCRSPFKTVVTPTQAFCSPSHGVDVEPSAEEDLMKALAVLKLQMKQKKKELKAYMKEDKKKVKVHEKEERKREKQKDDHEERTKLKCNSESSMSSSESCEEGCTSESMQMIRQRQSPPKNTEENSEFLPVFDSYAASCGAESTPSEHALASSDMGNRVVHHSGFSTLSRDATVDVSDKASILLPCRGNAEVLLSVAAMGSFNVCTSRVHGAPDHGNVQKDENCESRIDGCIGFSSHFLPPPGAVNRIEVCAGGKCKKAGSLELLSVMQSHIPRSANLEAVPCKCMGKCSMPVNVRVLKEDTNPQHHSYVGVEDGLQIVGHHFGVGSTPAGLPALSMPDSRRWPMPLVPA